MFWRLWALSERVCQSIVLTFQCYRRKMSTAAAAVDMGVEVVPSGEWSWPPFVPTVTALLAVSFLLAWFFFLRGDRSQKQKYHLPPGPPTWPIIGNMNVLVDTTKATHHVVDDLSKVYGPLMLLKVGVQNWVFVSDSELTMEFLKTQDRLFAYRPDGLLVGKYLLFGENHMTLAQPGDYHSFLRKFAVTELLGNKKLQVFRGLRFEEQTLIIKEAYLASQKKDSIDVRGLLNTVTLNVVTRMAFGKKFFGRGVEVDEHSKSQRVWVHIIPELTTRFGQILAESIHPSLHWVDTLTGVRRGMLNCRRRLDALTQKLVDEHKLRLDTFSPKELEEYEPNDFMDILLLQRGEENGQYVTDWNLKAISMDLIVAGSDTSATILEWCMSELIGHPELMKRVQEEVDSVVGFDRVVEESDIPNLPLLAAVIKETFRLHPPLPWLLPHSCRVDCKVGGYDIPKGSVVNFNVYGISRSDKAWEDPLRFNPDRFFNNANNNIEMKGSHPQLLPFGSGRRICPGIYMALAIVHSTLARMLHSFDWQVAHKNGATEIDMKERSGVVAAKLISLHAFPTSRLPPHLY